MSSLKQLLAASALLAWERQERLADLIGPGGGGDLLIDFPDQRIRWSSGVVARCELLGSEARGTWLWAWANDGLDFDDEVLAAARRLRHRGEQLGVAELIDPGCALDELRNGHVFGAVACELLGADAYYVAHGDPASVLTVITAPGLALPPADAMTLMRVITQGAGAYPVAGRPSVQAYLEARGARTSPVSADSWRVEAPAGGELTLTFDALDRVSNLSLTQGGTDRRL